MIMLLCVVGLLACLAGCENGNKNEEPRERTSTIRGNVADVVAGLTPTGAKATQFAQWKNVFTVPSAYAQTTTLGGITVIAIVDGVEIDTTTTDDAGNFTLKVSAGSVTLRFRTTTFSVSIDIEVPALSTAVIVVTVDAGGGSVTVITRIIIDQDDDDDGDIDDDDLDITDSLRCENGSINLDRPETDLVIDGIDNDRDDACLKVEGNCHVSLSFRSLTFLNCKECLKVEGNGRVDLTARQDIFCDDSEIGIKAEGNAQVRLEADENVTILVSDIGIKAAGNAAVVIDTPDCVIEADEVLKVDGNATVTGCGRIQ